MTLGMPFFGDHVEAKMKTLVVAAHRNPRRGKGALVDLKERYTYLEELPSRILQGAQVHSEARSRGESRLILARQIESPHECNQKNTFKEEGILVGEAKEMTPASHLKSCMCRSFAISTAYLVSKLP